ncbi:MAG: zinc ribbon domain-containing protein [Defluviitaleaceae bacterium]|nr:zinc ribbon domain-containing protein [Defluviitaleaceae bacterium]
MERQNVCQSCGMEMKEAQLFGTEANGTPSDTYCCYCYKNGEFEDKNLTMQGMIDICAPYLVDAGDAKDLNEAEAILNDYMPTLKRWAK